MNKRKHFVRWMVLLVALATILALAGCNGGGEKTASIDVQDPIILRPGEDVTLAVNIEGFAGSVSYEWSTSEANDNAYLTKLTGPTTKFTALAGVAEVIVSVTVSDQEGAQTDQVRITIEEAETTAEIETVATSTPALTATARPATNTPTATATATVPPPTETPTPAPTEQPLTCRHPAITSYIFPQLEDVAGQRAFYGPLEESEAIFLCQGVHDVVHSPPVAVHIEYNMEEGKYGFFGIGTLNGYDASQFQQICFWAYTERPDQAFRLKMRDMSGTEQGGSVTVPVAGEWTQVCENMDTFTALGVDVSRLDNINLGFEEANGSARVWVDDFELVP